MPRLPYGVGVRIRSRVLGSRPAQLGAALVAALVLGGCSATYGAPDAVTEQGRSTLVLWRVLFIGAALVAALIWFLVIWSVVRYRRRPDQPANPPQRQYNIPMEVVYTVTPILIVAFLFGLAAWATQQVDSNRDPELTVQVDGFQWQWQFTYPEQGVVVSGTPDARPTLVLPVGRTIRFELHADDVIHSFWVPEFLEKRDLIPGVDNHIDVDITEPGEWTGRCAEYCGFNHWQMTFDVRAVPADEFDAWVARAAAETQPLVAGTPGGDVALAGATP